MPTNRIGNVLVNGSQRQVRTEGDPLNRVVIKVDGITVYDRWNILQKKAFNFDLVPGKPASLRWQKIDNQIEYDVTVDAQTTRLARIPETAVEARDRKKLEQRIATLGCFAFVVIGFLVNRSSRLEDGSYYPSVLAIMPLFTAGGIFGLLFPDWKFESKGKAGNIAGTVLALALVLFGFTWFTHWFLRTFKYQMPSTYSQMNQEPES